MIKIHEETVLRHDDGVYMGELSIIMANDMYFTAIGYFNDRYVVLGRSKDIDIKEMASKLIRLKELEWEMKQ